MMKTSDFNFELPQELIAQTPMERRDASRLLTLDKGTGETTHRHFYDLPNLLRPGDCLVSMTPRGAARTVDRTPGARRRSG